MFDRKRFLTLAFTCIIGCRGDQTAAATPQEERRPVPSVATLPAARRTPIVVAVHSVLPSVVNIQVEATIHRRNVDPFFGFFGGNQAYTTQSVGSGFVWASNGIIVTNNHVVEGASRIIVNFSDGRQLPANVIGVDPDSDLAVLRVAAKDLPTSPLGSSADLLIGESVIAVGNPFGLSGSVTTGVVSATGRSVPAQEQGRTFTDFIQTDASINPGNSGGPLLNIEGKVIGINVAIHAQAQGIGFAIPVDRAKKIVDDLLRYGQVHSAWLGAVTATLTPEESRRLNLTSPRGAIVTRVFEPSPASRGGLRPGDIVVEANGAAIDSREALNTATATLKTGDRVRLRVIRGNDSREITLIAADPPEDLGVTILEQVSGLTVRDGARGMIIYDVAPGSRAAEIGLAPGDLIVGVNGIELRSVDDLNRELMKATDRSSIVLQVARGRFIYSLSFPLGG